MNTDKITDVAAERAASALARMREGAQSSAKITREAWREYGAVLLEKRAVIVGDKAFGHWVKANGLDQPPAGTSGVRSDAIWLAERWEQVQEFFFASDAKEDLHSPRRIRTACRKAGLQWAVKPEKKTANKPSKPTESKVVKLAGTIAMDIESFSKKDQPRLLKLLRDVEKLISTAVVEEVAKQLQPERDRLTAAVEELNQERKHYQVMAKGIKGVITLEEYRDLRGCMHPDRAVSKERMARAFDVVMKLEPYVTTHARLQNVAA